MSFNVGKVQGQKSRPQMPPNGQPPAELKQHLISAGIPENIISQGFEAVKKYAEENNKTLPAPPAPPTGEGQQSESIFGSQTQKSNRSQGQPPNGGQPPAEITSALKAGGATDAEIAAITGPQAAEALAAKYGVTLPKPPAPPQGGMQDPSIFTQIQEQQ